MSFFSRVFRSKDSSSAKKQSKQKAVDTTTPAKPRWTDAYSRIEIAPEEVQDLIKGCTQELKTRGKNHTLSSGGFCNCLTGRIVCCFRTQDSLSPSAISSEFGSECCTNFYSQLLQCRAAGLAASWRGSHARAAIDGADGGPIRSCDNFRVLDRTNVVLWSYAGVMQRVEMVLEQTPWRSSHLGGI